MERKPRTATPSERRGALFVCTLTAFIGPFMASSVNVALPDLGRDFSLGAVSLAWVNTAFLLAAAAFLIPFGRLGDILGRKRIFLWGILLFTASSSAIAFAPTGTAVILGRVAQGVGASMVFATGLPILTSVFPPGERGTALGINVAAVYLGLSTGPFIGGWITEQLGWRAIFGLNIPLGLLLVMVVLTMLRGDWAEARGARFDLVGAAGLGLSLVALMYGISSLPGRAATLPLMIGVLGLVGFVVWEGRTPEPILDLALFRDNTVFAFSSLAALVNYAATFAVSFLLSLYLQRLAGMSPRETGLVLIAQPVVQTLFSPLAGRLSDRIQPRTVASAGMGVTFLGLLLLLPLEVEVDLAHLVASLAVLGLGFALFSSPNTNAIMSSVEQRSYGVAGAMVGTMRQLGMTVSMGIVMMVLALTLGDREIGLATRTDFLLAMRLSFAVLAALCFGGIFASLARGEVRASRP